MTNRLELNWKLDGLVDEQRYYCSETPIDIENLPLPKAIIAGDARTYIDTAIEVGKTYYVVVGSVKNNTEKLSDEVSVSTITSNDEFIDYVHLYMPLTEDLSVVVGDQIITQNGANNSFAASGGVNNEGYYVAGAASYFEFEIPNFFGTEPFCIEYYMKTSGVGATGLSAFAADKVSTPAILRDTGSQWFVSRNDTSDWGTIIHGFSNDAFTHVAVVYDGTQIRSYANGVRMGSQYNIAGFTQTKNLALIGKNGANLTDTVSNSFQHLRITKGVPRYTENFVPPTEFIY